MQQQFLDSFWLPLLSLPSALPDASTRLQAAAGLVQLLASSGHWEQLQELLLGCFASLDAAVPGSQAVAAAHDAGLPSRHVPHTLPLQVACALLVCCAQQLQPQPESVGRPAAGSRSDGPAAGGASRQLLRGLLAGLRSALAAALLRGPQPARAAALRALLPATIAVSRAEGPDATRGTAQELWRLALTLLGGDGAAPDGAPATSAPGDSVAPLPDAQLPAAAVASPAMRTGLALLVGAADLLADGEASGVDAAASERFWQLLRGCLVGGVRSCCKAPFTFVNSPRAPQ